MEESPFELTFEESSRKSCYEFKKREKEKNLSWKRKGKGGKEEKKKSRQVEQLDKKNYVARSHQDRGGP